MMQCPDWWKTHENVKKKLDILNILELTFFLLTFSDFINILPVGRQLTTPDVKSRNIKFKFTSRNSYSVFFLFFSL